MELIRRFRELGQLRLEALEKQQFGVTHGDVSAAVIQRWGLPSSVVSLVLRHDADPSAKLNATEKRFLHVMRIGEAFDVRLTCAVLENDTVQVVPDESRLWAAGVQLPPFEIVGSAHPADTRAGQRRFFQYRYTLRLVEPDEIGQDLSLPRLPITYTVQSRVGEDARLAGRDFVPTSKKVDTPLQKIPMKFVDARVALDDYQKWEKQYEELFLKAKK